MQDGNNVADQRKKKDGNNCFQSKEYEYSH